MDKGEKVICQGCKREIKPGEKAIAISAGIIGNKIIGFVCDIDAPWKVYCIPCGENLEPKREEGS